MAKLVLGIETSCDETAAAVVEGGRFVLSNIVASQVDIHRLYGGVVPEIASREHIAHIGVTAEAALNQAGVSISDLDAVAVTYAPGLIGAVLVGLNFAKTLAYAAELPLVPVHHLEGHIYANFLESDPPEFPLLALVVSGGHSDLVWLPEHGRYELLGRTRDDAAGEAFDKAARVLGLPYPGGPAVQALAAEGKAGVYKLPRAWLEEGSLDFSFSGLKSAVINLYHNATERGEAVDKPSLAAAFQDAVVEVLAGKTEMAVERLNPKTLLLAGGVAANKALRDALAMVADRHVVELRRPEVKFCTDNAAMIAAAGFYKLEAGVTAPLDLDAEASLPLVNWEEEKCQRSRI